MKHLFYTLILLALQYNGYCQDSLFTKIAKENSKSFQVSNDQFSGEGWEFIINEVKKSQHLLLGEDHFTNEIPTFIKAIGLESRFKNFFIEVDPYTTQIISESFSEMNAEERSRFNEEYSKYFSFYALQPEYELLEYFMNSGLNLLGSDQILMYGEQLLFPTLREMNPDPEVKSLYDSILKRSEIQLELFFKDPSNPMYFLTPDFKEDLTTLKAMDISKEEQEIIENIEQSIEIYLKRSHSIRVNLIIRQLMDQYEVWKDSRTLFKYGANHLMRGESLLTVYDIGNVIANITEAYGEQSLHLMVVGQSGSLGSPFEGFPAQKIDKEKGFYLSYLKPFYPLTEGLDWVVFDLRPLRKLLNRNKLKIENQLLIRAIKGYDLLVIIPEVTPAGFE